jgi:hypothetical protein
MKKLLIIALTLTSVHAFAGAQVMCTGSKKEVRKCHKVYKKECKGRGYKYDKKKQQCNPDKPTSKHKKCLKKGGKWTTGKDKAVYSLSGMDHYKGECVGAKKGKKKKLSKSQKKFKKLKKMVRKINKLRKNGKLKRADKKQKKLIKKACKIYKKLGAEVPKYLVDAGVVCE